MNALTNAVNPVQIPEVQRTLEDLANAISRVSEVGAKLSTRLNPVLRSVPDGAEGKGNAPEVMLCPLADQVRDKTKHVHSIAANLEELLGRIEL